jgi:uncharacterized protein (TIGR02271 family)
MARDVDPQRQIIPVVEEELSVQRRRVKTGTLHVYKRVSTRQEVVDEPTRATHFDVERIQVNTIVDAPESIRQDGETTIIPVYEEVVVTETKLLLKEEIHVRRRESLHSNPQTVTLRKEEISVEEEPER